jgi:hypothetical protein
MVVIVEPKSGERWIETRPRPAGTSVPGGGAKGSRLSAMLARLPRTAVNTMTAWAKCLTAATLGVGRLLK